MFFETQDSIIRSVFMNFKESQTRLYIAFPTKRIAACNLFKGVTSIIKREGLGGGGGGGVKKKK